jgi:hypothetical protein
VVKEEEAATLPENRRWQRVHYEMVAVNWAAADGFGLQRQLEPHADGQRVAVDA